MSEKVRPILVTGAHRTGTTWVGKMLSANSHVCYISEPLNVLHRPGIFRTHTHFWYTYICEDNEADYLPGLLETLSYQYHLWEEINSLQSLHDLGRMVRDWSSFQRAKILNQRPLLKDPFAFFCAPWFAERLDCQVVITIRHPAAFVSSLKRLNWPFDLRDLLNQPFLMRDLLEPFQSEIQYVSSHPEDLIGHNSLLWCIIYTLAKNFQSSFPNFRMVRHEDLSRQPLKGFNELYHFLGMDFNVRARERILTSSNAQNPKELSSDAVHGVNLDSISNLDNWKHRLTEAEITRIREITETLAAKYYPEVDWG